MSQSIKINPKTAEVTVVISLHCNALLENFGSWKLSDPLNKPKHCFGQSKPPHGNSIN